MLLIGEMKFNNEDWDLEAYGSLFQRLSNEIIHSGDISRYVRYISEDSAIRFLGVEVDSVEKIPYGMTLWDLQNNSLTISSDDAIACKTDLSWHWIDNPDSGWITGDFSVSCPPEWQKQNSPSACRFDITANAYFSTDAKGHDDSVYLADYNPDWIQMYEEMADRLHNELGPECALRIEHYGSTSIPGMPAKPIIDILVGIPSFEYARMKAVPLFNKPEWEYWTYAGHMTFIGRESLMGERKYHIHMAPLEHEIWNGLIFRDYLRIHPEDALEYKQLKYRLAEQHRDNREQYTIDKGPFVQRILSKAGLNR